MPQFRFQILLTLSLVSCIIGRPTHVNAIKRIHPLWQDPVVHDPLLPQQIFVAYSGDPTEMIVSWVTFTPTATSLIKYGTDSFDNLAEGSSLSFLDPMDNRTLRYIHSVLVGGLSHNLKYQYRVGDEQAGFSEILHFKTLPAGDNVVNMIVYGDLGLINSQSLQRVSDEVATGHVDMVLHVGDYAYDLHTDNGTYGDAFLNLIQNISSQVPYQGCPGNHEGKFNFSHYEHRFDAYKFIGQKSGTNNNWWYSWDYVSGGSRVHFAAINTEVYYVYVDEFPPPDLTPQMIAQYKWLDQDLQQARENGADWIVVYGHRPMYCSNVDGTDCTYDAEVLRRGVNGTTQWGLEEILGRHKVDIYLCGHEHSYERTFPVYQGVWEKQLNHTFINPESPAHIISGSAGCQEDNGYFDSVFYGPWSVTRSSSWGYGHLTVFNSTHLYWDQLLSEGEAGLDYFWIVKDPAFAMY